MGNKDMKNILAMKDDCNFSKNKANIGMKLIRISYPIRHISTIRRKEIGMEKYKKRLRKLMIMWSHLRENSKKKWN